MLTVYDIDPDQKLNVLIAVTFAKKVLHIYEEKYPDDLRPRKAIEAAEEYLSNPTAANAAASAAARAAAAYYAARAAGYARDVTGYSANADDAAAAAAAYAAYAAYAAVTAASAAVTAASAAANAAADAATHAANAAVYAARAADATAVDRNIYIHNQLLELLPYILNYKVEHQQSFGDAEKVLEYLDEDQVDVYLFNLDILV